MWLVATILDNTALPSPQVSPIPKPWHSQGSATFPLPLGFRSSPGDS